MIKVTYSPKFVTLLFRGMPCILHVVTNRPYPAERAARTYSLRFSRREGLRDAKWCLGFAKARMFALFAIDILVMTTLRSRLLLSPPGEPPALQSRVVSCGQQQQSFHRKADRKHYHDRRLKCQGCSWAYLAYPLLDNHVSSGFQTKKQNCPQTSSLTALIHECCLPFIFPYKFIT